MNDFSIFIRTIWYILKFSIRYQENTLAIIKSYIFYYNKKIRISMASIIKIEIDINNEKKYILIKNLHRPELYAPIGGVYKHRNANILEKIAWEEDTKHSDMDNDLRGFIDGKYFSSFISWFYTQKDREGSEQCIYREFDEELLEGKNGKVIRDESRKIQIDLVKNIVEGPNSIIGRDYEAQYRYFKIYKPNLKDDLTKKFIEKLKKRANDNSNKLILVTKNEIIHGRTKDNKVIAPHTKYFFFNKWHGTELQKY